MSLKISRILHAGYVLEQDKTTIAFDPIFENPFSRNCHAFPPVDFDVAGIRSLRLDAVFISHYHDDHCSFDSLDLLNRETPIYMFCVFDEMFGWLHKLGFVHVHALRLDEAVQIGSIEITARRALDEDVDCMFQIKAGDLNVLNVVDSWIGPETLLHLTAQAPWDLIMWPFQTMREIEVLAPTRAEPAPVDLPVEWFEQLSVLKPTFMIASSCQFSMESWSWYNHAFFPVSYAEFRRQIEAAFPPTKVLRLDPGSSLQLQKHKVTEAEPLTWMHPAGDQNVDYSYNPDLKPPPTAEIAKRFSALNRQERDRVIEYCEQTLAQKYSELEPAEDRYFDKARPWRLSLYDHEGKGVHYHYMIEEGNLTRTSDEIQPQWSTEVPMRKLLGALDEGESLTSMYVRINAMKFDESTEKKIGSVDILEDPLIRCLFTGAFGSYQQAQLRRLVP